MKIAALCPTYKRPEMLGNSIALFLDQRTSAEKRLFVLDDAGQFDDQSANQWELTSIKIRFPDLPAKYNCLAKRALLWGADAFSIWEDDDVFFPWHLENIAHAVTSGIEFVRLPFVKSNYGRPKNGDLIKESAAGRFHSSWGFSKKAYELSGGWPDTPELNFDQQFRARLETLDPLDDRKKTLLDNLPLSYVYRWGNPTYHGSAVGDKAYKEFYAQIGKRPAPWIGTPKIEFDAETQLILARNT